MCNNSSIVLFGKSKIAAKWVLCRADCDSWQCAECAAKMVRNHQARIIQHCGNPTTGQWSFVTLTAHETKRGAVASLDNLKQGWTKLAERLRRQYGTRDYVLMHEQHKDGSYHVHMLYNAKMSKKWLKSACRACGMGYMADAQTLRESKSAGKYVTKYLTKAVSQGEAFPKRFKRVRYSQGFPALVTDKDPTEYEWKAWTDWTDADEDMAYLMARKEGVVLYSALSGVFGIGLDARPKTNGSRLDN